jgi:hypothetical protein
MRLHAYTQSQSIHNLFTHSHLLEEENRNRVDKRVDFRPGGIKSVYLVENFSNERFIIFFNCRLV